jgi:general nucleoside transport system permease protein
LRVALSCYLFGILQSLASVLQSLVPEIPTQVFSVAPFVLMIVFLVATSSQSLERGLQLLPPALSQRLLPMFRNAPPAALGESFEQK